MDLDLSSMDIRAINSMVVKPAGDHILVSVEKEADGTLVGLIVVPNNSGPTKKTVIGRVTAVGPGIDTRDLVRPITVEVGQQVIIAAHVGFPVNMGDRGEHILVKNNDVLAVIELDETRLVEV